MVFPGCDTIKLFLDKHTSIEAIKRTAASCILLEEGSFRKVYRIAVDDNPHHVFQFKNLTKDSQVRQIENEVAAINYVRRRTSRIPTPEVIAYSTVPGQEWIALQLVQGQRLSDAWPRFSSEQKWDMIHNLVDLYKLFAAITLPDAFGATKIGGFNLDMSLGETVESAKSFGRQKLTNYNNGPYQDVEEYLRSYIDKEIAFYTSSDEVDMQVFDYELSNDDASTCSLSEDTVSSLSTPGSHEHDDIDIESLISEMSNTSNFSAYVSVPTTEEQQQRQKNLDDFVVYLQSLKSFVGQKVDKKDLPCLTHNDFHAPNIIVNGDLEITCLYNWEFSGFYPLSLTYEPPSMASDDLAGSLLALQDESIDWCEAFNEIFGNVKEVHPLVASVLEPMDPLLTNAWEE
ncbi:Putative uncharacterized protein [Taphrina deformans PYCC 5710]|uniref:Uncharacterized protein n=1 Tax=Taphrina deformans (strain PYCC 5710 / ATCC 11124 / CBS 356.35 / IMI 108563 / JCM 9778 / NBRC 8474) TaxID=1097556 RepID=R4XA93_TAPDE|nr:Putative uncharacterized protein [Taphrina deformans PYCC 5710]|eukprot:CCG82672.1 Putative uncharacterized protein [Taphrina deformans PYCC 5710]